MLVREEGAMTVVVAINTPAKTDKTLQEGRRLAYAFDDELQVVHVMSFDDTDFDIGVTPSDNDERLAEIATDQVREAVGETITDCKPVGLFGDDVVDELLQYLDDVDVRYLVVGGRRRSPVGKAVFGSTAQSILLQADFPVVSVY